MSSTTLFTNDEFNELFNLLYTQLRNSGFEWIMYYHEVLMDDKVNNSILSFMIFRFRHRTNDHVLLERFNRLLDEYHERAFRKYNGCNNWDLYNSRMEQDDPFNKLIRSIGTRIHSSVREEFKSDIE